MGFWNKFGKIALTAAPYIAAPFTGGLSLLGTSAANKAVEKWSQHDANNAIAKGIAPSKFDKYLGLAGNVAGLASGVGAMGGAMSGASALSKLGGLGSKLGGMSGTLAGIGKGALGAGSGVTGGIGQTIMNQLPGMLGGGGSNGSSSGSNMPQGSPAMNANSGIGPSQVPPMQAQPQIRTNGILAAMNRGRQMVH